MSTITNELPLAITQTIDNLFSLSIKQDTRHTVISMRVFTPVINTAGLPITQTVLKKCLPSVLKSKCFNTQNLPFSDEVKQTEIGHLYEHILLEYLCFFRIASGAEEAMYRGNTSWNWHKEPIGTFHITISAGSIDQDIFALALDRTTQLVQLIMQNYTLEQFRGLDTQSAFHPEYMQFSPDMLMNSPQRLSVIDSKGLPQ
jgi:hypothetical protein